MNDGRMIIVLDEESGITKVTTIYQEGDMNVCTKYGGNTSNSI